MQMACLLVIFFILQNIIKIWLRVSKLWAHNDAFMDICIRGDNCIIKKVRAAFLVRDTPTGPPLYP